MTKNRKMNGRGKGPLGSKPESVSGRQLYSWPLSTVGSVAVQPSSFTRALAIADVYQFYRFTKLKIRILPEEVNAGVSYAPGALFDTPPTTSAAVVELPLHASHGAFKTTDTILEVGRKELLGDNQIKWYKTIVGTPSAQFETQGNIYYYTGPGAGTVLVIIDYTVEFQSWNLAAQSPLKNLSINQPVDQDTKVMPLSVSSVQSMNSDVILVGGVTYKKSSA